MLGQRAKDFLVERTLEYLWWTIVLPMALFMLTFVSSLYDGQSLQASLLTAIAFFTVALICVLAVIELIKIGNSNRSSYWLKRTTMELGALACLIAGKNANASTDKEPQFGILRDLKEAVRERKLIPKYSVTINSKMPIEKLAFQQYAMAYGSEEVKKFAQKWAGNDAQYNFKCDIQTLEYLGPLLARIEEDALGYDVFHESFTERLTALEQNKGIFLDSQYSSVYRSFYHGAVIAIHVKQCHGTKEEKEYGDGLVKENYSALKGAIDNDYLKRTKLEPMSHQSLKV
jgi:hypothetical protein